MRTADEILEDELSDNMVDYLKGNQIFKAFIIDAMYQFAKEYHDFEISKLEEKKDGKYNKKIRSKIRLLKQIT